MLRGVRYRCVTFGCCLGNIILSKEDPGILEGDVYTYDKCVSYSPRLQGRKILSKQDTVRYLDLNVSSCETSEDQNMELCFESFQKWKRMLGCYNIDSAESISLSFVHFADKLTRHQYSEFCHCCLPFNMKDKGCRNIITVSSNSTHFIVQILEEIRKSPVSIKKIERFSKYFAFLKKHSGRELSLKLFEMYFTTVMDIIRPWRNPSAVVDVLKFFCLNFSNSLAYSVLNLTSNHIHFILCMQKLGTDLFDLWMKTPVVDNPPANGSRTHNPINDQIFQSPITCFMVQFVRKFDLSMKLLEYGVKNSDDTDHLYIFRNELSYRITGNVDINRREYPVKHLNRRTFLTSQIIFLYLHHDLESDDTLPLLHRLWRSISDPFITKAELMETTEKITPCPAAILNGAWNFYNEHVVESSSEFQEPRCLKQLVRCTIRGSLVDCFNLPFGIQDLDIPFVLKSYLLLEH